MASVSVSHSILFIASLIAAAGVAGTLVQGVDQVSGAIDDRSLDISQNIQTDVQVITDSADGVYNRTGNENITLLVKNTGSITLPSDPDRIDVIVDGQYHGQVSVTVFDDDRWTPDQVARLEINATSLPSGDHRVKLVVNTDEEVFEFRT